MIHLIQNQIHEAVASSLPKSELKHIDKYLYVVSLINHFNIKRRKDQGNTLPGGWTNISSRLLIKRLTTARYQKVISHLVLHGIIDRNDRYKVPVYCPASGEKALSGFAKSFRVSDEYWLNELTAIEYRDERFASRLIALEAQYPDQTFLNLDAINHIKASLNRLQFDAKQCLAAVNSIQELGIKAKRLIQYTDLIEQMRSLRITQCNQERLYHFISNMSKFFRPFFTMDGEKLIGIDIVNSQMIQLADVLSQTGETQSDDLIRFKDLAGKGKLYSNLMGELGFKGGEDQFKKAVFRNVVYAKLTTVRRSRLFRAFAVHYPVMAELLLRAKRHDHSALPRLMQKIEAHICINGDASVVMQLAMANIPVITLHDAFIVKASQAARVAKLIAFRYKAEGYSVQVKLESWEGKLA